MSRPAKVTASASGRSRLPPHSGHVDGVDELQHPPAHRRALRVGQGVQDVALGAGEGARCSTCRRRLRSRLGWTVDGRLLVGEQDPVAVRFGQLAPRRVDVVAERDQDVAQVLALPGTGPGGDRALADASATGRAPASPRSPGARGRGRGTRGQAPIGGVRRERVGVQPFGGARRIACRRARTASAAGSTASSRCRPIERDVAAPRRCCSATAGGSPVMSSTFGRADLLRAAAARTARPTRSSDAAPRRRSSRRPATTCPSRTPR